MNARQKADAEEQRLELFRAVNWTCPVCGEPLAKQGTAQLAHRVPRRESMLMKWGSGVINSPLNMVPVDSLKCNALVSLGTVGNDYMALLERIVRIQTGREAMPDMAEFYSDLRAEFAERRNT